MNLSKDEYKQYADAHAPRSPIVKNCLWAFFTGGFICLLGQGLNALYGEVLQLNEEDAGTLTAITLVALAVLLTGLGVFDRIAKHAGAGTLVPITGFANAVASPAIDSKSEGFVLGVGAKIFTVAGPVLLYGISAGAIYGVLYWLAQRLPYRLSFQNAAGDHVPQIVGKDDLDGLFIQDKAAADKAILLGLRGDHHRTGLS